MKKFALGLALESKDPKNVIDVLKNVIDVLLTEEWIKILSGEGKSPSWVFATILGIWKTFELTHNLYPEIYQSFQKNQEELERYIAGKLGYL